MSTMYTKKVIEVVEFKTGETVHSVDITTRTEREAEKIMRGMLRNLNTDDFYLREASV